MKCILQSGTRCLPVTAIRVVRHDRTTLLFSGSGSVLLVHDINDSDTLLGRFSIFPSQNIHGITRGHVTRDGHAPHLYFLVWGGRLLRSCRLDVPGDHAQATLHAAPCMDLGDWILDIATTEQNQAVLLTAHNDLFLLEPSGSQPLLIAHGPRTLLYSGHVMIVRSDHILIASGTVFGEIIVWTCHRVGNTWITQQRHTFLGHKGSVFGVCLSDPIKQGNRVHRLLASCSDDRTIRIWDVSDCAETSTTMDQISVTPANTGFGNTFTDSCLTKTWGHSSRIWSVCFMPQTSNMNLPLVSRGEDGVCQVWDLGLTKLFEGGEVTHALVPTSSDKHHTGKHVWSYDTRLGPTMLELLTGGADGQIVARYIPDYCSQALPTRSTPFPLLLNIVRKDVDLLPETKTLRQYLVFDSGCVLAATNTGDLLIGRPAINTWTVIERGPSKGGTSLSCNPINTLAFFVRWNGSVAVYDVTTGKISELNTTLPCQASRLQVIHAEAIDSDEKVFLLVVNLVTKQEPILLRAVWGRDGITSTTKAIPVPPGFIITSSCYEAGGYMFICGSRDGALCVFTTHMELILHARHVHSTDTVTAIIILPQSDTENGQTVSLLTTGRDGTYAIHKLTLVNSRYKCRTLHRSTPPIGPFVEGAYLDQHTSNLVLYGFRSKEFLVWDESTQTQLMAVECGGAYRSWTYNLNVTTNLGTFVWTRAGEFYAHTASQNTHRIIQHGGHGREIKALAIQSHNRTTTSRLLATGAEDTNIRLFELNKTDNLTCIALLKDHTTGLQHLSFSRCGEFLLSSAGYEEFLVWRLSQIPLVRVGAVVVGRMPKGEHDFDARIMDFDIHETHHDRSKEFLILTAYSNGKARLLRYNYNIDDESGIFESAREYDCGSICLTQACLMNTFGIVGSTDGHLRLFTVPSFDLEAISKVHQSNIAALALATIQPDLYLVVTGGDDNALGVSLLSMSTAVATTSFVEAILLANAHAAALTALSVVAVPNDGEFLIVTAGNDQRIKLWRVIVTHDSSLAATTAHPDLQLECLGEHWTDVADISSIGVTPHHRAEKNESGSTFDVVVAGVGMQSFSIVIIQTCWTRRQES